MLFDAFFSSQEMYFLKFDLNGIIFIQNKISNVTQLCRFHYFFLAVFDIRIQLLWSDPGVMVGSGCYG